MSHVFFFRNSGRDYLENGQWVGLGNCTDPKQLFESIVFNADEIVQSMSIKWFETDESSDIEITKGVPVDTMDQGRCYTYSIPLFHGKSVKQIKIKSILEARIFVHSPGMLFGDRSNIRRYLSVGYDSQEVISVEHQAFDLLDSRARPCISNQNYVMDKCIDDEIYMVRNLLTRSVDHNFVFHIFLLLHAG